ncbi:DnaB-like helicase C-terminal domain-containing protein [Hymenobacter guriensis]|uniref:DnaB-like helicase C-terminal domain-containing protein n=1 Tax=Hymenobacter guriensis TaxID=2793065 RepID=A0ABS0L4E4_9BACT|nr:DnaB-like helicase C-terminal domain-containing protein [Hymenobacter guriensis]MBG8555009.1 DnaB-like helicase C-terminal domain-containing protein [Hymenobacter guriensis]
MMENTSHTGRGPMFFQLEEDRYTAQGKGHGVPSGLAALDRVTRGWQPGTLTVVAAAPSMGCTSFLVSCMNEAAVYFGEQVALFSLQHSKEQIIRKCLCALGEVAYEKLLSGLPDYTFAELANKVQQWDRIAADKLYILDEPAPSLNQIRAQARQLCGRGVSLILIDNLHRLKVPAKVRAFCSNREQEISYLVRGLKTLARELKVPIVVVSHLNRLLRDRPAPSRPQLGDLRDSGSIEYEADLILFLHRNEYYGESEDEMGNPTREVAEIIVAKNAFGSREIVQVQFKAEFGRFSDTGSSRLEYPSMGSFGGQEDPKPPFDDVPTSPHTIKLPPRGN